MFNLVILAFPVDYRWCSTDCSKILQYRVNMEYIESTTKQKKFRRNGKSFQHCK